MTDHLNLLQVNRATQAEEDNLEMQVRASNMVRAGESLMKLVSDLKARLEAAMATRAMRVPVERSLMKLLA